MVAEVWDVLVRSPLEELPEAVCGAFLRTMGADGAALSVGAHTVHWQVLHACGPLAMPGEEAQYTLGAGPTMEASARRRPVLLPDLTADEWPLAGPLLEQLPRLRTVLALALDAPGLQLGVLTLYFDRTQALTGGEVESAQRAARMATAPLAQAYTAALHRAGASVPADPWLRVHQAIGRLAARTGCSVDDALALLRAHGFALGRPLPQVARQLLYEGEGDSDEGDPDIRRL